MTHEEANEAYFSAVRETIEAEGLYLAARQRFDKALVAEKEAFKEVSRREFKGGEYRLREGYIG